MKAKLLFILLILFISSYTFGQNTVGVLQNSENSYNGYTLFSAAKDTYLINNCGEVINKWTSNYDTGKTVYLLGDGSILRAGSIPNSSIFFPGIGGILEKKDWNNNLTWSFTYSTSTYSQHHDAVPLPNGNILMNVVEVKTKAEAIAQGRNPANVKSTLFNEKLVEIQPTGTNTANIVWEWSFWDHLIQDFDSSKANFGNVKANPQLLDINFLSNQPASTDWIHANSVQYNAQLDQVVVSSALLNEFYVIDHSTTTSQAASHFGGTYGKGGDFLYRWGNPLSYRSGSTADQKLFGQHFVHWIPSGLTDANKIMVFNNGRGRPIDYSSIDIINPPVIAGVYGFSGTSYGPVNFDWTYMDTVNPVNFYSKIMSSAQRLPNGNTLIDLATSAKFIEIDSSKNIVWEYISPLSASGILSQGDDPSLNATAPVFRVKRYATNYTAFTGKNLTPGKPIELNPNISFCSTLSISKQDISNQLQIYPNPISDIININTSIPIDRVEIYDIYGKLIKTSIKSKHINIENIAQGMYFAKIYYKNKLSTKKFIKL